MTHVSLIGLTKVFDDSLVAVDNLNLEIESGNLTALLGPSGCGKTTTMKMIAGLLRPNAGDIYFDGNSILNIAPEKRGAVMVFQNYLLFPYMNVGDNIGFGLKMRGVNKKEIASRVAEMLELVQLPGIEKRKPTQLSGGQQQRVALARALIVEPNLLLLDEPLSNLDAHLRDEMRELVRNIQREFGITTIFVTHDQEEAVVLADKIALIFDGVLQQYAQPSTFFEEPSSVAISRFFGGLNFLPGSYADGGIHCACGQFQTPRSGVAAGKATLSIRPEAIQMGGQRHNDAQGIILSHVYVGRYARFRVQLGEHVVEAVTEPGQVHHFQDGSEVTLHFPPEKIWVLPVEEANDSTLNLDNGTA